MSDVPAADSWQPYVPILAGAARTVLAALGGVGFTWALTVNADQIQMVVSAAMVVGAAGWSAWQKVQSLRKARDAARASAIASATATVDQGSATAVVVPPKP